MKTLILLFALAITAYAQNERVIISNPDPGFYQPHAPGGGYEPISTGPAYVDNGEVRPSLPYPYKQYPNGGRGGK